MSEKKITELENLLRFASRLHAEDHRKIEKATEILIGHCSGYFHCQKNCYDELKEALGIEGTTKHV